MRVLLGDDDSSVLKQTEVFLEDEDERLDIDTAISAEEGLQKLSKNDYDAIVSDYQMPEMDGLEFLKTVREKRNDDIPFIMFTGKGREDVAMEALNLGADRHLKKGGDPKSQYSVLAQAIVQEVEHGKAEGRLEKAKERARKGQQFADVGIWEYDNEDESLYWNPTCERLFGLEEGEFEGTVEAFLQYVHPEDRDLVLEENELIFQDEKDVVLDFEHRIVRKDGETRWVREHAEPVIGEEGEIESDFRIVM